MSPNSRIPYKTLYAASVALLAYSALTAVALVAWFSRAGDAWTWRSVLALVSCVLGVVASAIVWRFPSRAAIGGGIAVYALAYVRVAAGEWTWTTPISVLVTTLLLAPLVAAMVLMPRG